MPPAKQLPPAPDTHSLAIPGDEPADGIVRRLCCFLSNLILQFPLVFEIQQKALNQPEILRREVLEEISKFEQLGPNFTVIDYGCGSGTYTGLFDNKHYLGIECNQAMIDRASSLHPGHSFVQASDLTSIREHIDTVSHIFMIGVIHHLTESDLVSILSSLPSGRQVQILAIDTLKCSGGPGAVIQLFERGDFLRTESDHKRLLARVADEISYKKVPYGQWFELAVFRGYIKPNIK